MAEANSYATFGLAVYPAETDVADTAPTYGDPINVLNGTLPDAGTMPDPADVRRDTPVAATVGTLDVPVASSVLVGVPVDAGVGNYAGPAVADVRAPVTFGANGTQFTGLLTVPVPDEVLLDTLYDNDTQTGTIRLPAQIQVELNVVYGPSDLLTGSLDPGVAGDMPAAQNVRSGVIYDNGNATGNLIVPATTNVRIGIEYDGLGLKQTGIMDLPAISNVRLNVPYDNLSQVGNVRVPPIENVLAGYRFDTLDSKIGTLSPTTGGITPSIPPYSTLYGVAYDEAGSPEGDVTIECRIILPPDASFESAFDAKLRTYVTVGDGIFEFTNCPQGSTYQIRRGDCPKWSSVVISDQAETPVNDFIGIDAEVTP